MRERSNSRMTLSQGEFSFSSAALQKVLGEIIGMTTELLHRALQKPLSHVSPVLRHSVIHTSIMFKKKVICIPKLQPLIPSCFHMQIFPHYVGGNVTAEVTQGN